VPRVNRVNGMADPNAEFWNKQAAAYTAADGQRRSYHSEFAAVMNAALTGEVLCIGGLYQNANLDREPPFSIVDVSEQMLSAWAARGARVQLGDARKLPTPTASVDHVVYPLVLHHITDGSAAASRRNVAACFREAMRVLRPGGTLWAIEILVSGPVYWAERTLAPLTRRALALKGIPLVIFHSREFYLTQLAAAGFAQPSLAYTTADDGRWFDLVRPVIGLGLLVPKFVVPVRYGLLRGIKRS
jgi:SAM-dependent methyltransferase